MKDEGKIIREAESVWKQTQGFNSVVKMRIIKKEDGHFLVDLREFIEQSDNYQGFTKKGFRFSEQAFFAFMRILNDIICPCLRAEGVVETDGKPRKSLPSPAKRR